MPNTIVSAAGEAMPAAKINRRLALLGGLTAAALIEAPARAADNVSVASPIMTLFREHPDAELLQLDKEMEAVHARMERANAVCVDICNRTGGNVCPESEAAEKAFGAIVDDLWKIGRRIFAIPAHTPQGMAVKLRAGDRLILEDFVDRDDFLSIAVDIRRLAGESAS
ncbi:hypothetical protein MesoLjLc_45910 [Mesorhizobium sp. L-8-10]|uniref:hypothetical protein n=1 Tax=Mesorhizobium sp. L-8-10 TaxID=2744523 RepID=UPI0019259932|nr:hypothetical protein [Mesorhizobium sp. L-8-10]BCH32661.1 hypothetical protein MesoLjLc_45910 [Mesorhizobium sp. L-8-10]